jgi:hypothetical protein
MRIENLQLLLETVWRPGIFSAVNSANSNNNNNNGGGGGGSDNSSSIQNVNYNCLIRLLRHFSILFETDLTKENMTLIYT